MTFECTVNRYALLCLDNNPVNAEQWRQELSTFATQFDLLCVTSIEEAHRTLRNLEQQHQVVALVVASQHPAFNGAGFLVQLDKLAHTKNARKILISSAQDIQPILNAVNQGRLDYCLTQPLQHHVLRKTVQQELTTYLLDHDADNILSYSSVLEQSRILQAHIDSKMRRYREGFISDYHQLSDGELAEQVIGALYQFFEKHDETRACRTYSANHLLTKEGTENRFLWFISSGEVALYKEDEQGQQREVVRHPKGNIVGGMSFVTGEPSFSTAITLTKTDVIKLDRAVFAKVMHSDTRLLPLFTNLLLRHFNRRLQRSITTKITLQQTLESLESAHQQLIEREKMAMLGQLVAGVAHELNNPVAAILRAAETLAGNIESIVDACRDKPDDARGAQLLHHALRANPMSTAQARNKANALQSHFHHRVLAKKLVTLGLDQDGTLIEQARQDPEQVLRYITQLEQYHLAGTNLRALTVCSQRIADMVKSLKGYARSDDETFHQVDIHEGLEDTLMMFESRLKMHHVEKEYASIPAVRCLPIALQQVWTNLIANAIDALPERGTLHIQTKLAEKNAQTYAVISITDNGCGIAPQLQQKIFALNFTTKREGNFGLGIGLSVCQQIVRQHQGWIEVDSQPGEYTTMHVWLPLTTP